MNFYNKVKNKKGGFTLIEMIIVIGMIITVTAIVLFNNAKLNSAVLVSNTAYEIGLIVRESQIAGLGVKAANNTGQGGPSQNFNSSHGVHVDIASATGLILFADSDKNKIYDSLGTEMTQEYKFGNKRSGTILAICGKLTTQTGTTCTPTTTSLVSIASADITFTRPNPEAFFMISTTPGGQPVEHVGSLIINVGFANDVCRSVIIEKTGAVQVDTSYCPPIQ